MRQYRNSNGGSDALVAANDDMALGAVEARKGLNLTGKAALIGFDTLPEALASIQAGTLTATIRADPGRHSQSRRARRVSS